jgi:Ni,Fe-hydrogenase I small subunit
LRVIQVVVARVSFADTLGAMRNWLDQHGRPLVRFETASDADAIVMRVQFDDDALAEAFRQRFDGTDAA